jgi:uncharacterized protein (DUF1697 family)
MTYVALLRGINVGGNRTVDMRRLKAAFEGAGMAEVRTYINSGNVIFSALEAAGEAAADREALTGRLGACIVEEFGFEVDLILRTAAEVATIAAAIPADWANDDTQRCDVFYLWPDVDRPNIVDELGARPGIDELRYVPGAVIRWVARENVTRSGVSRILGGPLIRRITIRNCNTARKLAALAAE